jgi:hypothetical protein
MAQPCLTASFEVSEQPHTNTSNKGKTMNIQHTTQIQQIRYAKQYTPFARRSAARRGYRVRRFGIAFTAIAAMVGFSGAAFTSSAHAQRPMEGSSVPTAAPSPDKNTFTSPCFRGPNNPFASYEQVATGCTHTYGAPDDSFGFVAGGGPAQENKNAAEVSVHQIDHISGYEQFAPAAATDGWAHHMGVQIFVSPPEETDGWAHHTEPAPESKPGGSNWKNCFASADAYQAWSDGQVGMPNCAPTTAGGSPVAP